MDNDFDMVPVESGNLVAVGFNEATKQGRVEFKKGAIYEYSNCTQEEADSIINAPSANDAFNATWKGTKPFRRL